jgi:hypothetical protein
MVGWLVDGRGIEPYVKLGQVRAIGRRDFAHDPSRRGVAKVKDLDPASSRAVAEYLSVQYKCLPCCWTLYRD